MTMRSAFIDFVQGLLDMDPITRWSPHQAEKHPFITGERFTGHWEVSRLEMMPMSSRLTQRVALSADFDGCQCSQSWHDTRK
jgi:serine/threonine protein kinase